MKQVIVLVALAVSVLVASNVALGERPQVLWSENIMGHWMISEGLKVENVEIYRYEPGQRLFRGKRFRPDRWPDIVWEQPPQSSVGIRTELNRAEPLILRTERSGYLYAVLWKWDFGFLPHGPKSLTDLNGWELVAPAGQAKVKAPAPFFLVGPVSQGTFSGKP